MTASVAHLKIKLDDVERAVIRAGDVGWGVPDPDFGDGPLDARKTRLIDALEDVGTRSLKYLYDFGDGWEHTVRIERVTDPVPDRLSTSG